MESFEGINSAVFYATNATALNPGTAEIEIILSIKYKRGGYSSQSIVNVVKAKVEDPITTYIPTYINGPIGRSDLLLIPPESIYKLITNKKVSIRHSLACSSLNLNNERNVHCGYNSDASYNTKHNNNFSDIVNIHLDGTVVSNNQKGRATVLIENEMKENEFQLLNLLVTPINSIFVMNSYKASILPLQSSTKLKV